MSAQEQDVESSCASAVYDLISYAELAEVDVKSLQLSSFSSQQAKCKILIDSIVDAAAAAKRDQLEAIDRVDQLTRGLEQAFSEQKQLLAEYRSKTAIPIAEMKEAQASAKVTAVEGFDLKLRVINLESQRETLKLCQEKDVKATLNKLKEKEAQLDAEIAAYREKVSQIKESMQSAEYQTLAAEYRKLDDEVKNKEWAMAQFHEQK